MRFVDPVFLWLLALAPVWWWWERRVAARRGGLRFSSVEPARQLGSFWSRYGPTALRLLRGLALILAILALARPQLGRSETRVRTEGIDIVLAIDVSGSMQALDFKLFGKPVDRLTIVKRVVREFITARVDDRIGLVAFAGRAYIASPLTLDHDWLETNLDRIKIGSIEDGTAIGLAIGTAVNRLRDTPAKGKVIVLLTDGVNNVTTVLPEDAARAAAAFGARVYTIGVGTRGEAPMPVFTRDGRPAGYRPVRVEIDEDLLQRVAELTGGQYFRATDTDSLREIYRQIDQLEKREIETTRFEDWREAFAWCLGPALGCWLVALALEQTRLRRLP